MHFTPKKLHRRAAGLQDFTCLAENNLVASMKLIASLIVKLDPMRDTGAKDAEQCFYGLDSH